VTEPPLTSADSGRRFAPGQRVCLQAGTSEWVTVDLVQSAPDGGCLLYVINNIGDLTKVALTSVQADHVQILLPDGRAPSARVGERLSAGLKQRRIPPINEVLADARQWVEVLQHDDVSARRVVIAALVQSEIPTRVKPGMYRATLHWTPLGAALYRSYRERIGEIPVPLDPEMSFDTTRDEHGARELLARMKRIRPKTAHLLRLPISAFEVLPEPDQASWRTSTVWRARAGIRAGNLPSIWEPLAGSRWRSVQRSEAILFGVDTAPGVNA
jgi:hypothetical protein